MSKRGRGNEERPLRDVSGGGRTDLPAKRSSEMPTATTDHNFPEHNARSAKRVPPIQDRPSVVAEPEKSTLQGSTSWSKVMPESAPNLAVSQGVSSDQRGLPATDHENGRTPSKSTDQTTPVTSGVQVARRTKRSSLAGKPAEPVEDKPPVPGDPAKKVPQDSLLQYDELSKPGFATGVAKDDSTGHQNLLAGRGVLESPGSVDLAAPMTSATRELHGAERDLQVPKLLDPAVELSPLLGQPMSNVSLSAISRDNELPKPRRSGVHKSNSPGRQCLLASKDVSVCPGSIGLLPSTTSVSRKGQKASRKSEGPKVLEPAIDMSPFLGEPLRKTSGGSISRDSELALPRRSSGIPKSDSLERQSFLADKEQVFARPGFVGPLAPTTSGIQLHGTEQDSQVPKLLQSAVDMTPVLEEPVKTASEYSLMQGKGILKPRRSSGLTKEDVLYQQGLVAVNQDDTGSRVRPIPKAVPGPHGSHQVRKYQ